ncbi:MAG: helix-turn-helix domain-containing protein [Bacteroides cellulosilyticus]|nr:helix-turn-helix domain-containing protein [Bacteroides cellulosilyticus]
MSSYIDFTIEDLTSENITEHLYVGQNILFIKCLSGEAAILTNAAEMEISAGTNFLVSDGGLFQIRTRSCDIHFRILRFPIDFFNVIYSFLSSEVIEMMDYTLPIFYSAEANRMLDMNFEQLCWLHKNKNHAFRNSMLINTVVNYIHIAYEQTRHSATEKMPLYSRDRATQLAYNFYANCCNDSEFHRNIQYFADKMNITPRYLYKVCKESMGYTPKEIIDYNIVGEAKKLLLTTTLTIQEISIRLKFPDSATFGQYFKRIEGVAPQEFRHKFKRE